MPRLSIVIPCVGGAAEFDGTLVSVLQHRPSDCEVLVIHALPYDDPYALQGEVRFIRVSGRPNLVGLINTGVEAAKGEIVHIVACGLEVCECWTDAPLARLDEDDQLAAVSPIIIVADKSEVVAAGVAWSLGGSRRIVCGASAAQVSSRSQQNAYGPIIHAGFFRREELCAMGGFDERLGELSDVGLALTMRETGLTCALEPQSQLALTSPMAFETTTKSLHQARLAERLFWQHSATSAFASAMLAHVFMVSIEWLAEFPRATSILMLLGRLLGLFEFGSRKRHDAHVAELRSRIAELRQANPPTLSFPAARPADARAEKRQAA